MGYLRHQIDIAEFDKSRPEDYAPLMAWRVTLPLEWSRLIIGPVDAITNAYVWFIMLPDGSKEGWEDSNTGDEIRERFRTYAADKWGRSTYRFWFGDDGEGVDGIEDTGGVITWQQIQVFPGGD